MILMLHIIVALASIACAGYAALFPAQSKIRLSYVLAGLTLASGTYLVAVQPAHLTQACISGLVYLAIVFSGLVTARYRLKQTA